MRSRGDNNYTFEAKHLDIKQDKLLEFKMSGLLEAADPAVKAMKSPKDIFFPDLDDKGKWKVVKETQKFGYNENDVIPVIRDLVNDCILYEPNYNSYRVFADGCG